MTEVLNPLGIPQMLLIIALLGFALWKTSWIRLLLSLCIIIWGVFAVTYDIKVGIPLVAIGSLLFFMALFKVWRGVDIEKQGG